MDWKEYIHLFTTLFVIVDPISIAPLYLIFTRNVAFERPRIARITGLTVGVILSVMMIVGEYVLRFFNISIDAFRLAGGLILVISALNMLQAKRGRTRHTPEEDQEAIEGSTIAVVPLATPLLAGPAAMSTVMVLGHQMQTFTEKFILVMNCMAVGLCVWFIFHFATSIEARLSTTAINIIMRILGVIVAAIAIEFIVSGLRGLLPGLAQ